MRAATPQLFVPELGNFQTEGMLKPRRHDPAVTPLGIGGRLLKHRSAGTAEPARAWTSARTTCGLSAPENPHIEPAIFNLRN